MTTILDTPRSTRRAIIDDAAISELVGQITERLVFRPGVASSGNAYATWGEVISALGDSTAPEGLRFLEFDDTFAPCVIPAGVYNMQDVAWVGLRDDPGARSVSIADGVTITNLRRIGDGLAVTTATAGTSPIPGTAFLPIRLVLYNGASLAATGASALIDLVDGTDHIIYMQESASLLDGAIGMRGSSELALNVGENCAVEADAISGGATETLNPRGTSTSLRWNTQTSFGGTVSWSSTASYEDASATFEVAYGDTDGRSVGPWIAGPVVSGPAPIVYTAKLKERVYFNGNSAGSITISFPASPPGEARVAVKQVATGALGATVTLGGNGEFFEDPLVPGTFVGSKALTGAMTAGQQFEWEYNANNTIDPPDTFPARWYLVSKL